MFFHSVKLNRIIKQLKGGLAYIDCLPTQSEEGHNTNLGLLTYLSRDESNKPIIVDLKVDFGDNNLTIEEIPESASVYKDVPENIHLFLQ